MIDGREIMAKKKENFTGADWDMVVAGLGKKFGKGLSLFQMNADAVQMLKVDPIPTNLISLDNALGIFGFPQGRIIEIYGPESGGKAQPLFSKVLTKYGFRKMGDLQIGDSICTPDGGESTVIGIFPQGRKPIYRITLDDKSSTLCTGDHLWLVHTRGSNLGEVLSTEDLLKRGLASKNGCKRFKLPTCQSQRFQSDIDLPVDPYLLGLLLGDGSLLDSTVKLTTADEEILGYVQDILDRDFPEMTISEKHGNYDYNLKKKQNGHSKSRLFIELEKLGLTGKKSEEKFIPEVYLLSSIEQRTALLQGLMDSDGTVGDGTLSFSTSSPRLSLDFQFLTRSLGFRCTTSSSPTKYVSKTGNKIDGRPSFRSTLLQTENIIDPFRLQRKLKNAPEGVSDYRYRFVESIELFGEEECQCIQIGHPDQLYITDDFIVTHNTTLALQAVVSAQKLYPDRPVLYVDLEHALDPVWMKNVGVDFDNLWVAQPDSGEDATQIIITAAQSGKPSLIVLDSVAAVVPQAEIEGEMTDQQMGMVGRIMGKFCRKIVPPLQANKTALICINQTRMKLGPMPGEERPGGKALRFFASQVLRVRKEKNIIQNQLNY